MKKGLIALRIWDIDQEIKALEDERGELRAVLETRMKPGEAVPFETEDGPFRVKLCVCEEKVLNHNASILDKIGIQIFLQAAKVGCGALQTALKNAYRDDEKVSQVFESCIAGRVKKNVLKLLRGIE